MAKTNVPVWTQGGRTVTAVVTAAKTTYNDATNVVKLGDAGPEGSLLKLLSAMPRATATASNLQLYRSKNAGVTLELIDSALMAAHTVATTTAIPKTKFADIADTTPIRLEAGESLYVASSVALAGGIMFNGQVEDF